MKKEEKYRVVMHKFIGYGPDDSATYEITFNKSLVHTGRMSGIADGLNRYVKNEYKEEISSSFIRMFRALWYWIRCW